MRSSPLILLFWKTCSGSAVSNLPVSIDAEQALLGAVLMNPDAFYLVSEEIDADCFSEPLHVKFWEMIAARMDGGRTLDPVTLAISLGPDAENLIDGHITVREYIARLAVNAVSIISAPDYARTIREMWKRRRLIGLSEQLAHRCNGGFEGDIESLIDEFDSELTSIRYGQNIAGVKWLKDAAHEALEQTALNYEAKDKIRIGLETGIKDIDELIGPMMAGDLITIVAPSGHGKTSIAAQILCAASAASLDSSQGRPSFFVSQEMGAAQIARRVMASWTGVSTRKQRAGSIDVAEYEQLESASRSAAQVKILFDESGRQTFSRIARKTRAMKKLYGIGAMAVDHLRLIKPEHSKMGSIETIEHAAMGFKDLAKELDIVVFQLAQLSREGQKTATNWRFTDQALWGGDMIKQASDVMLGVVIPQKWLRQRQPDPSDQKDFDKWVRQMDEWKGRAEIGTLKVRDGDDGDWRAVPFSGERMLFGSAT